MLRDPGGGGGALSSSLTSGLRPAVETRSKGTFSFALSMAWPEPMGSSAIKASLGARGPGGAVTLTAAEGTWEQEDTRDRKSWGVGLSYWTVGLGAGLEAPGRRTPSPHWILRTRPPW